MFRIGLRMTGQTHNVVQQLHNVAVRDVVDRATLAAFAQGIADEIKTEADVGMFELLTLETVNTKARRGSPTPDKPWFDRPFLVDHVFLKPQVRFYKSGSVTVTIPTSNRAHPRTGVPLTEVLGMMEDGTPSMPARPIIAPVFERVEKGESPLLEGLQSTIKDNLERLLR